MELKQFCSLMELSGDAEHLLKNHWDKILQAWDGSMPEFLSETFIRKHLPFLQIPEDETEILTRSALVIRECAADEFRRFYVFVLHYAALVLKLQPTGVLKSPVWGENEGIVYLIAALSSAPLIAENCRKKGIPEHYATDVLQWIGGTVGMYKLGHNGIPGHALGQIYVLGEHIAGKIYRIGRFEYMVHRLPEWMPLIFRNDKGVFAILAAPGMKFNAAGLVTLKDEVIESFIEEEGNFITGIPCTVEGIARVGERLTIDKREFKPLCSPWDTVPSIHIPGGLPMRWDDAISSMKEAKEFFRCYLKKEVPMFICGSWILNPALEKFAPEGNMARFRRETFNLPMIRWGDKGRDGMFFAFGRNDVDPTEITPVNSIQKILQEIFKAEGTLRTGAMFVLCEDLDKLGEQYYRKHAEVL